jgi:hypothetical protein
VVVGYLDIIGIGAAPREANPPLVIDPDRVLTGPLTAQLLQAVSWKGPQISERLRTVQHDELAQSWAKKVGGQASAGTAFEELLCLAITEAPDHERR